MAIEEHRQAEDEPGKCGVWQRLLTEQLPVHIWTTDRDLEFIASNGDDLKAFGPQPSETAQTAWSHSHVFQADSREPPHVDAHQRSLLGEAVAYETVWQGRNFQSQTNPLRDRQGNIIGVVGAALDITEHKQAEAAVCRFRMAMEGSQDGIYIIDRASMRHIDVNETAVRDLGYSRKELLNMGPSDVLISTEKEALAKKFDEIINSPQKNAFLDAHHRRKDGSAFPVEVHVRAMKTAGKPVMVAVARDISEHKLAEDALRKARNEVALQIQEQTAELQKINAELRAEIANRKRTEELLRDSEERHRSIVTAMAEGAILQQSDGRVVTCNPSAAKILGLSIGHLVGSAELDPSWRVIHEDGSPFLPESFPAMISLREGTPCRNVVMGIQKPDEPLVWLSINSEPLVCPSDRRPYAVVTTFSDITTRKNLETARQKEAAALLAAEIRFRLIFDNIQDGILVADIETRQHQFANPAICRMLGYTQEEMLKLGVSDMHHAQDLPEALEEFDRLAKGEPMRRPLPMKKKDGSLLYAEMNVFFLPLDGKVFIAGAFRDITERKLAQEALQASEQELKAIFEQAAVGVAMIDSNSGRFLKINRKYADIIGYSPEETLVADFTAITHPDDLPAELGNMQLILQRKIDSFSMEKRLFRKDRSVIWVNLTVSPLLNNNDSPIFHIAIMEDITRSKQAKDQTAALLQQNRNLAQHLFTVQEKERRHLARELHDEVGQWLTAIQLYACTITDKTRRSEPGASAEAEIITQCAQRINQHISRIMHGLRPVVMDETGLPDGLRHLVSQWQIQHPGIECRLSVEGELDDLGDHINITVYRIVQESLTNVVRHADARCVTVALRRLGRDGSSPDMALLTIEDDGKGLDFTLPAKGLGLPGIRERVLAVNGEFVLSPSTQRSGLRLEIRIPLG